MIGLVRFLQRPPRRHPQENSGVTESPRKSQIVVKRAYFCEMEEVYAPPPAFIILNSQKRKECRSVSQKDWAEAVK